MKKFPDTVTALQLLSLGEVLEKKNPFVLTRKFYLISFSKEMSIISNKPHRTNITWKMVLKLYYMTGGGRTSSSEWLCEEILWAQCELTHSHWSVVCANNTVTAGLICIVTEENSLDFYVLFLCFPIMSNYLQSDWQRNCNLETWNREKLKALSVWSRGERKKIKKEKQTKTLFNSNEAWSWSFQPSWLQL